DDIEFDSTTARYLRIQGVRGHATYGYSMYALHAYGPGDDQDLAAGSPATASSEDAGSGHSAARVTDGDPSTRWAVTRSERTRPDSWIQVDRGEPTELDAVRVAWESAAGAQYDVQVSDDGASWATVASFGNAAGDENVARL